MKERKLMFTIFFVEKHFFSSRFDSTFIHSFIVVSQHTIVFSLQREIRRKTRTKCDEMNVDEPKIHNNNILFYYLYRALRIWTRPRNEKKRTKNFCSSFWFSMERCSTTRESTNCFFFLLFVGLKIMENIYTKNEAKKSPQSLLCLGFTSHAS